MLENAVDMLIKEERSFLKVFFQKTFHAEINLKENITKLQQSNDDN